LAFYRLNPAIERGTKPDAVGWKPCHWARTLKAARSMYSNVEKPQKHDNKPKKVIATYAEDPGNLLKYL
jgi:hypothetical protein